MVLVGIKPIWDDPAFTPGAAGENMEEGGKRDKSIPAWNDSLTDSVERIKKSAALRERFFGEDGSLKGKSIAVESKIAVVGCHKKSNLVRIVDGKIIPMAK